MWNKDPVYHCCSIFVLLWSRCCCLRFLEFFFSYYFTWLFCLKMLLSVCFSIEWISIEVHSRGSQHMRHPSADVCGSQAVERAAWSPGDTALPAKTTRRGYLAHLFTATWSSVWEPDESSWPCDFLPQCLVPKASQVALHILLLIFITLNPVRKAYVLH